MAAQEVWKTFEPENYYKTYLDNGKRPDGRELLGFRPITVKAGTVTTADGSATVRLGHSVVICGIKAEVATPSLSKPEHGFVVPNVELYSMSSRKFLTGAPGMLAMDISMFLQKVLSSTGVIDLTDLCLVPNKYVWSLYCDVVCLNYDGNMYDASLLAIITALQNVRLPTLTYDEDNDKTTVGLERTNPICVKSRPVSSTFTLYSDTIQLADPTDEDEENGSGEITAVTREDGSLCYLHKPGGRSLPSDTLDSLVTLAGSRVEKVNRIVSQALTEAQ